MSYEGRFMFAAGLKKSMYCPVGTFQAIMDHITTVERVLGLKRVRYETNPVHWDFFNQFEDVKNDDLLCKTVAEHNQWVHRQWDLFTEWSKTPVKDGERITPKKAQNFWHGLTLLSVEPSRWSNDYYRDRMECLYEVMRGRPGEGINFDSKALTASQASSVITLFSEFLDRGDIRLAVPRDRDYLKASYDGGYDWCEIHGAIDEEDFQSHAAECKHFKEQFPAEFEDEEAEQEEQ